MSGYNFIKDTAKQRLFVAGQEISCVNNHGVHEMYIILNGEVQIIGGPISPSIPPNVTNGGCIGVYSMFCGREVYRYRAKTDVFAFTVTEENFETIAIEAPKLAFQILQSTLKDAMVFLGDTVQYVFDQETPSSSKTTPSEDTTQNVERSTSHLFASDAEQADEVGDPVLDESQDKVELEESAGSQPDNVIDEVLDNSANSEQGEQEVEYLVNAKPSLVINDISILFPNGHKKYPDIIQPEYSKLTFEANFTCPHCQHAFKGRKVFESKLVEAKPARYDGRKYHKDFSLEWYSITTCPKCYFSTLTSLFDPSKPVFKAKTQDTLPAAKASIQLDFENERDINYVFAIHYLAILCAQAQTNTNSILFRLWSALSYLYEDIGDKAMHQFACQNAADAGQQMYTTSNLNAEQEQSVCMTTAGMFFNVGNITESRKWIFRVKSNRLGKKVLVDRADDLIDIINAKLAEEK